MDELRVRYLLQVMDKMGYWDSPEADEVIKDILVELRKELTF